MPPFITYLTPPLVGAFIGYMTNYVAIRMLFRPLKPWYVGGVRVPLTPGVIPSKRKQLAENIGEMVGEHLLTSKDVQRALTEKGFQKELAALIDERITALLQRDLGPLPSIIPERFRSYFHAGVKILNWRVVKFLHGYLDSEVMARSIRPVLFTALDDLTSRKWQEFLAGDDQEKALEFLGCSLDRFVNSAECETWLRQGLKEKIDEVLRRNMSIRDLLTEEFTEILLNGLEAETPKLLKKIAAILKEPGVQERISHSLVAAISKFTESLGPMAALVQGFISPDMVGGQIREYLDSHSDEIADLLFDAQMQTRIAGMLRERVEKLLTAPLGDHLNKMPVEKLQQIEKQLADYLLHLLRQPALSRSIVGIVRSRLADQAKRPLQDILTDIFGGSGMEKGRQWLAGEAAAALRSSKARRFLDQMVTDLTEKKLLNHPIGPLSELLPKEVQNGMGDYLLQQISDLLVREVPGLVDSLNIRQMVAAKVNSLDLLRLESLLLSIMEEQFKYINLFGGILGFFIGLINLVFLFGL